MEIKNVVLSKDEASENRKKDWFVITIRVNHEILSMIDDKVSKRLGMPRNAWILEAIQEKMEKCNA